MLKNIYSTKSNHFSKTTFIYINKHKKLTPYFSRNTYFEGHLLALFSEDELLATDLRVMAPNTGSQVLFYMFKSPIAKALSSPRWTRLYVSREITGINLTTAMVLVISHFTT